MAALGGGAGGTGKMNYQCVQTLLEQTDAVLCIVIDLKRRRLI
jgi:hypothetical protein